MLIGYARVSTDHQDTAAQVAALDAAECERIYREKASGGRWNQPRTPPGCELEKAMLRERTKAGLAAARDEGRIGGRRPKLSPQQQSEIRKMVATSDKTAADAARLVKVHPATVSRLMDRAD